MDLYQGLVLGFLALVVLVLAGIFARLGPIRRSLDTSAVQPTAGPSPEQVGAAASVAEPRAEPETGAAAGGPEPIAAGEPESVSAVQPEPVSVGEWELVPIAAAEPGPERDVAEEAKPEREPEREEEPVAAEEPEPEREEEPVAAEEPELERDGADEEDVEPVAAEEPEPEREEEPVAAEEPEPEREEEPVAAEEPEPEEKPFQRDGRWWFRRDDELLVYDEASGEWLPGDAAASSFLVASEHTPDAAHATGPDLSRGTASVATREREPATEEGQGFAGGEATEQIAAPSFWKCSTCGAVNGSTASTCRMCFAARP
jgi:hypothetical protein